MMNAFKHSSEKVVFWTIGFAIAAVLSGCSASEEPSTPTSSSDQTQRSASKNLKLQTGDSNSSGASSGDVPSIGALRGNAKQ